MCTIAPPMRPAQHRSRILKAGIVAAAMSTGLAAPFQAAATVPLPTSSGGAFSIGVTSWRDMPFRRVVRQQYDYSCGSAALATLLRFHYSRDVSEADIFKAMYDVGDQQKIRKVGFSLLDMKQYLAKAGLVADGYKLKLADIEKLASPGIVLVSHGAYKHFVVVKGIAGDQVLVGDPAIGSKTYTRAQFSEMWTSGIFFAVRQVSGGKFNNLDEWRYHLGPVKDLYLAEQAAAGLTRETPTLYQISPVLSVP